MTSSAEAMARLQHPSEHICLSVALQGWLDCKAAWGHYSEFRDASAPGGSGNMIQTLWNPGGRGGHVLMDCLVLN